MLFTIHFDLKRKTPNSDFKNSFQFKKVIRIKKIIYFNYRKQPLRLKKNYLLKYPKRNLSHKNNNDNS